MGTARETLINPYQISGLCEFCIETTSYNSWACVPTRQCRSWLTYLFILPTWRTNSNLTFQSTWSFGACSWTRTAVGFIFRSIILFSILACPSDLASDGVTWFCWFCPFLFSSWFIIIACEVDGSAASFGNYRQQAKQWTSQFTRNQRNYRIMHNSCLRTNQERTSTCCLNKRYLPWVLLPPTWTVTSHCKQRELPSTSQ